MDDPGLDKQLHFDALSDLGRLNAWSRTVSRIWQDIGKVADTTQERPVRVLDLACGGGDMVLGLERLARRRNKPIRFDGCDISSRAIHYARLKAEGIGSGAQFFKHNVVKDTLPGGYQILISSLFLHHLSEGESVTVLERMDQAAETGCLVTDLQRCRIGYFLAYLASRTLTSSSVVQSDSLASVRAAFRIEEVRALAAEAGLQTFQIKRCWPFRFLLSWRKH